MSQYITLNHKFLSSLHLCLFSKQAVIMFLTQRPGMTSVECVAGTTRRVKPWQGLSTMLSMVRPTPQIT